MWVKVPKVGEGGLTTGERVGVLLGNYSSSPNANWEINQGEVRIYWNSGEIDARGTTDLKDDKWHHLAFVRDTSQNKFFAYIDGNLELTENSAGSDIVFTTALRIGGDLRNSTGGPSFHGQIDEFRIWSKALTQEEIRERVG